MKTQERVNKILENVMNRTRANISIGQLLEIAPYSKKQVMVHLLAKKKSWQNHPLHTK